MSILFKILYVAREFYRKINSSINFLRIKSGLYRKAELPEYDPGYLESKWPYKNPCCVSDNFTNSQYDGKTNLSIIVPLYNSSEFIERLFSQLTGQRTKYKYEIIFVDDGSTDDTGEKLRKLHKGGGGYKIITQENRGVAAARNAGINVAEGEYISFVDSDDEILELFVEKILDSAYKNNADSVKCFFSSKFKGKIMSTSDSWGFVWGGVYDRNIFMKVRFPENYWYEDMINGFLIKTQSKKSITIQDILYFKNITSKNISRVLWRSEDYKSIEQIYLAKSLIQDYYKLGFNDENYISHCALKEFSALCVGRTRKLDEYTRKQIFLECHEIMKSFRQKPSGLTRRENIFYNAIMSKDFTAWNLAINLRP